MTQINAQGLSSLSVNGQTVPPEGARSMALALDFSLTEEYSLNLQNIISRNIISMVQSLFVDNSANASSVTVSFPNSQQSLTVAPGWQGYFSVLCPNPAQMNFMSAGGVTVKFFILNYPVSQNAWPTANI